MNHIRQIALTLLLLSPLGLLAQQAIDSAMKSLESSKSVTNEIYSERRNPSTKELESASYLFEFSDNKLAEKIIDAMRKERSKASSYEMSNRHSGSVVYTISFENPKDQSYAKYTLIKRGQSKWMLSVKKSSVKSSKSSKKSGRNRYDRSDIFGIDNLQDFNGIDNSFATIDGNTTVFTGPDGETIIFSGSLNNIDALHDLDSLNELNLKGLEGLENLRNLENLKGLENLKDLGKLKGHKKMKCSSSSSSSRTTTVNGDEVFTSITYNL